MKKKKLVIIGIIILFICVGICGCNENRHDGIDSKSIQEKINLAVENDTIYISKGVYFENIKITKPIIIIGEDKNTTILNGNGSGIIINISANYVKINSLTITNSGPKSELNPDAGIKITSNYNTISDCNISSNLNYGIYLFANPNTPNSIYNNTINFNTFYNNKYGIYTSNTKTSNISSNKFTDNTDYGIYLNSRSNDNLISDNLFTNNNYAIRIKGSEKNTVMKNLIMNNKYGLYFCCGAKNNLAYYNDFLNNTVYNAKDDPINIWDNGAVGNYWDNYNGMDTDSNGIGDTPYIINNDIGDRYPLIQPIRKKYEILGYNVTTEWSTGCCGHFEDHIESGFYPTEYLGYGAKYIIKGEIKNIAEEDINLIIININFLAKNGTILFNTELLNSTYYIYNLSKEYTKSFIIEVYPELYDYFNNPELYNKLRNNFIIVESLEFSISTW